MPHGPDTAIRLIATDLDGTLLNSQHKLTPLTEQAIRDAVARGMLFTVATGKTFPSTVKLIEKFDIQIPVISSNGTIVNAPDGTILHEEPIPREYAIEAIEMAKQAGLIPMVYAGFGLLTTTWNGNEDVVAANARVLRAHYEPEPQIVPNLEHALAHEYKPHKIIFMKADDLDLVASFQIELETAFEGRADALRTGLPCVVELMPRGVTKGTALAFILDRMGLSFEETICFGDNCNDLDMIRRAGIGVAMAQSPQDVRDGADYVTMSNDDDGVALALRKFILGPRR